MENSAVVWNRKTLLICNEAVLLSVKNEKPVRIGGDLPQIHAAGFSRDQYLLLDKEGVVWSCNKKENDDSDSKVHWMLQIPRKIEIIPTIIQISTGKNHALLLDYQNCVWSFGSNSCGQLAVAPKLKFRSEPREIEGLPGIMSVRAIGSCSFFIDLDKNVWAVGKNNEGNLGLGDTVHRSIPEKVPISSSVTHVTALAPSLSDSSSEVFAVILDESGKIWFLVNTADTLDGEEFCMIKKENPNLSYVQTEAKKIISILSTNTILFVDEEGQTWGLGEDIRTIFGLEGSKDNSSRGPTKIEIPGGKKIRKVAGGATFAFLLDEEGEVWVCGDNSNGQLGMGNKISIEIPEKLEGLPKIHSIYCFFGAKTIFVDYEGNGLGLGHFWSEFGGTQKITEPTPIDFNSYQLSLQRAQFSAKSARK